MNDHSKTTWKHMPPKPRRDWSRIIDRVYLFVGVCMLVGAFVGYHIKIGAM